MKKNSECFLNEFSDFYYILCFEEEMLVYLTKSRGILGREKCGHIYFTKSKWTLKVPVQPFRRALKCRVRLMLKLTTRRNSPN